MALVWVSEKAAKDHYTLYEKIKKTGDKLTLENEHNNLRERCRVYRARWDRAANQRFFELSVDNAETKLEIGTCEFVRYACPAEPWDTECGVESDAVAVRLMCLAPSKRSRYTSHYTVYIPLKANPGK
ncbi:hypothetical protein BPAE_0048g00320 [Botrytis paeoniae]|uniref:Uncharacterized protein n=1 Tax=Botrytis paeoniae TaxID=278948 RepID=A0A4Z1FUT4_9HELO|nr:hypothetical protein BPAE_0048g00320 [Botrytis paeoniae]